MESKKYIIALDLDGTLLNDKKHICYRTIRYLRKLEKQGHHIVITSGRAPRSIYKFRKILRTSSPYIGYNGILAKDPSKKYFDDINHTLNKDIVKEIYNNLTPYVVSTFIEGTDSIYYDLKDDFLLQFFSPEGMKIVEGKLNETIDVDPYIYIFRIKNIDENRPKIEAYFKTLKDYEVRFWWSDPYAEVYRKGISKGSTIKEIASNLNIDDDHILAFGDADNDIEFLRDVKNSFAMINGQPSTQGH